MCVLVKILDCFLSSLNSSLENFGNSECVKSALTEYCLGLNLCCFRQNMKNSFGNSGSKVSNNYSWSCLRIPLFSFLFHASSSRSSVNSTHSFHTSHRACAAAATIDRRFNLLLFPILSNLNSTALNIGHPCVPRRLRSSFL